MNIDTILGLIGMVLGILGILTGYIFYKKSLKLKEPCVSIKSFNIVDENVTSFDGLDVFYLGEKIKTMTISDVLFWNKGAGTVHRQDIAENDLIRISSKENCSILRANIITTNNFASGFSCLLDENKFDVIIDFDYIDQNQGCVIRVVHTGNNSDDILLLGSIKGTKLLKIAPTSLMGHKTSDKLSGCALWLFGWGIILVSVFIFVASIIQSRSYNFENLFWIPLGIILLMNFYQRKEYRIPEELAVFIQ